MTQGPADVDQVQLASVQIVGNEIRATFARQDGATPVVCAMTVQHARDFADILNQLADNAERNAAPKG